MIRLCYDCIHIEISSGWTGTDVTPGDPAELRCNKRHWDLFSPLHSNSLYNGTRKELKDCLLHANDCPDFTDAEHVNLNEPHVYVARRCQKCRGQLTKVYDKERDRWQVYCLTCSNGIVVE